MDPLQLVFNGRMVQEMRLFTLLLFAVLTAFVYAALYVYMTTPVVTFSHSTCDCIRVEPESVGTCSDLPRVYITVWEQ